MKKQILLILSVITLVFSGCTKEADYVMITDLPATQSEIMGTWRMEKNAFYYIFTFTRGQYQLHMENAWANAQAALDAGLTAVTKDEYGTYEMEGNVMKLSPLEGEAVCSELTAYWADESHNLLNLSPMGQFMRPRQ